MGALLTVEICPLWSVILKISLKLCRRHLLALIQLTVSCCELNIFLLCRETDWNIRIGKQGYVYFI